MRIVTLGLAVVLCLTSSSACGAADTMTDEQKTLYAIGLALSQSLGNFMLTEAELEFVQAGLTDGVLKRKTKVELQEFGPKIQELQKTRAAKLGEIEKKTGEEFLAKAAAEKGATKTDSGIVIQTLTSGSGASPTSTDSVKVHYHGTLIDGTVFDSSVERGEPITFPLGQVIPCWTEGLQLMKVGSKSRMVCPSNLAYGDRGAPPKIRPGATLVFEVELLDIVKEAKAETPAGKKK